MTLRVAAVAALGTVLLAGCAAGPSPAEVSASASASALASSEAALSKAVCENMQGGGSVAALAKAWVDRGASPDTDTAAYRIRGLISTSCPQYAGR